MDWFPQDVSGSALLLLVIAAYLAGLIDSIVGGGGLIQIPALFSIFPTATPALLLGTNKLSSICGTSVAATQYARRTRVRWNAILPAAMAALVGSFAGAWTVMRVPPDFLRRLLPFVLIAVALYTFLKKDLGETHAPRHDGRREQLLGAMLGAAIGFYDGFFGPGTGSFLIFLYVRFFGFDFLSASAGAKVVNVACNIAALVCFGMAGHIWLGVGLLMGAANAAGSITGSRLAIAKGSQFVRRLFLVVVTALICKTAWDAFKG